MSEIIIETVRKSGSKWKECDCIDVHWYDNHHITAHTHTHTATVEYQVPHNIESFIVLLVICVWLVFISHILASICFFCRAHIINLKNA